MYLSSSFPAGSEPNTTMPSFLPWVGLVLIILIVASALWGRRTSS